AVGLGLLSKQTFGLYLFPLLLYLMIQARKQGLPKRNLLLTLAKISIPALILSLLWYITPSKTPSTLIQEFATLAWRTPDNAEIPWFYLRHLFLFQMGPIPFLITALAMTLSLVKRKYFLPVTLIYLLAVHSLFVNREERFIYPAILISSLLNASVFLSFHDARRWILGGLLLYQLIGFFAISYLPSWHRLSIRAEKPFFLRYKATQEKFEETGLYGPIDQSDLIDFGNRVYRTIPTGAAALERNRPPRIFFMTRNIYSYHFNYLRMVHLDRVGTYKLPSPHNWDVFVTATESDYESFFNRFDYLVFQEGIDPLVDKQSYQDMIDAVPLRSDRWEPVQEIHTLKNRFAILKNRTPLEDRPVPDSPAEKYCRY
ncbi:MAG TPA: hypothetical protein PK876_11170, partial [Elusimicrobiota bacterium]|nr:hypothetical protein [Elusimicrobiota bacterium]